MNRKSIWKVTIYNDDRTTIYVIADNKLRASNKYEEYLKEHYSKGFIDETIDFTIEFFNYVYE